MQSLSSHEIITYKSANRDNSFLRRRRKLVAKIDEQILIEADPSYKTTNFKWEHIGGGCERKSGIPKEVRRWWTEQLDGAMLPTIRYGGKVMELEKGKNAIELLLKAELEPALQSIKQAVDSEGLDRLLKEYLAISSHLKKY